MFQMNDIVDVWKLKLGKKTKTYTSAAFQKDSSKIYAIGQGRFFTFSWYDVLMAGWNSQLREALSVPQPTWRNI